MKRPTLRAALLCAAAPPILFTQQAPAADVDTLPGEPTTTITNTGNFPTFNNRDDGLGTNSDRLDATFVVDIDFDEKTSGERENIFETGGGTIGTSFAYEAPSTLVGRTVGNGGNSLLTVSYALPSSVVEGGEVQVGLTIDIDTGEGELALTIIVGGAAVASAAMNTGGDWSGSDQGKFATGGGITANGANGTIPSIAFASGTINTGQGLRFYADTHWVPVSQDEDDDGLPDWWEELFAPGDLSELASGGDADGDGLNDEDEFSVTETNPVVPDTDGDGLSDGQEADTLAPDFTGTDPLVADTDADGLSDGDEVNGDPATDPLERDSDGDGVNDGDEVAQGSDPNSAASLPDLGVFLVAHYPLDGLGGGGEAVDSFGSYHLLGDKLGPDSVVAGRIDGAVAFDAAMQTMLSRQAEAGDGLPISQHPDHTIAMWVKVAGTGQSDLRLFSEASTTENNSLYNLGTHNTGADGAIDVYLRDSGNTSPGHQLSTSTPLDGTWHHIAWVRSGDSVTLYVDGVADATLFTGANPFTASVGTTSLGGIRRAAKSHWVTGAIDEVSLWSTALNRDSIAALAAGEVALSLVDDADDDELPDQWELVHGFDPDDQSDGKTDPDDDTLDNLEEFLLGTDPNVADTDGDTLADNVENDSGVWTSPQMTGTSPRNADTDRDGIEDNLENPELVFDPDNAIGQPGTNPNRPDTDGDGISDGPEATAGSDPTNASATPMVAASAAWCADDEPLGVGFGGDGWALGNEGAPAGGVLNPLNAPEIVAISAAGAAQTGLAQTADFSGNARFNIASPPDSLRDLFTAGGVERDATLEMLFSPDSLSGGNQYLWESGGTGDGQGIVLINESLYLGVNDGNNPPYGNAITPALDLTPLYGGRGFAPDDYLLLRAVFEQGRVARLGVTHLRTGAAVVSERDWLGNSWDGGDVLGLGGTNGGRGGDRFNQLSNLPGASTTWSSFDGQIAKFSYYQAPLLATVGVVTTPFAITDIGFDSANGRFTLVWNSEPDTNYALFWSPDGISWDAEIDDSIPSAGDSTEYAFPHPAPDVKTMLFRVERP